MYKHLCLYSLLFNSFPLVWVQFHERLREMRSKSGETGCFYLMSLFSSEVENEELGMRQREKRQIGILQQE